MNEQTKNRIIFVLLAIISVLLAAQFGVYLNERIYIEQLQYRINHIVCDIVRCFIVE